MQRNPFFPIALFSLVGMAIAVASIHFMRTIVLLSEYYLWFKELNPQDYEYLALEFAMFVPSIGLVTLLVLLACYRFLASATRSTVLAFFIGAFFTSEIAYPNFDSLPYAFDIDHLSWEHLSWCSYSFHFAIISSSLLAYFLARSMKYRHLFKVTSGYGAGSISASGAAGLTQIPLNRHHMLVAACCLMHAAVATFVCYFINVPGLIILTCLLFWSWFIWPFHLSKYMLEAPTYYWVVVLAGIGILAPIAPIVLFMSYMLLLGILGVTVS